MGKRTARRWGFCRICMTLNEAVTVTCKHQTLGFIRVGTMSVLFIPIYPVSRAKPGTEQSSLSADQMNEWMIQIWKWTKSPPEWLPTLRFSDSYMPIPLLFALTSFWGPGSTTNPGVLRLALTSKGRLRTGWKSNIEAERLEASPAESFQVSLPQKFLLATVIALALGLEGGGSQPANGKAFQSVHLVCGAFKSGKKQDCE